MWKVLKGSTAPSVKTLKLAVEYVILLQCSEPGEGSYIFGGWGNSNYGGGLTSGQGRVCSMCLFMDGFSLQMWTLL